MDDSIRVVTWNVNGMLDKIKRGAVLRYAKTLGAGILLLQETHLMGTKLPFLARYGYAQIFHAGFTRGSRGVAVLVRKDVPLVVSKVTQDRLGRYILISGSMGGRLYTFCSVYAPPPLSSTFLEIMSSLVANVQEGLLIMGGDWNATMNPSLDRRRGGRAGREGRPLLDSFAKAMGLADVWRIFHPGESQYTFHSGAHGSFSRLDYFLVPRAQMADIRDSSILARGLSDHAPVELRLDTGKRRPPFRWRLSTWTMQDPEFRTVMAREVEEYFAVNTTSDISPTTLWEAGKATWRGVAISWTTAKRKSQRGTTLGLEQEVLRLQCQLGEGGERRAPEELKRATAELRRLLTGEARKIWLGTQDRIYQWGDKSSKLLYNLCHSRSYGLPITQIVTPSGVRVASPREISDQFALYYEQLYGERDLLSETETRDSLAEIPVQALSQVDSDALDELITLEELEKAIGEMNPGKSPGPNGFPCELLKAHLKSIGTPLLHMIEEAAERGAFDPDMQRA